MSSIFTIDCTLRDGGYINNWGFDNEFIHNAINSLINTNIDIIECGFINEKSGSNDYGTNFKSIEKINSILANFKEDEIDSKFAVMVRLKEFNPDNLLPYTNKKNTISIIRVMVYKNEVKESISIIKKIIDKGYEVHIQPTIISHYSENEIIEMLNNFNCIKYSSIAIVDTFGALNPNSINKITKLFNLYANKDSRLTIHCHNNLSLAYENTISFINEIHNNRNICIDSSIYGLGRGCGNLKTEKIIRWLNIEKKKTYKEDYICNFSQKYLNNFQQNTEINYTAYKITAQKNIHPNYATELLLAGYKNIEINKILQKLPPQKYQTFDKSELKNICKQL